MCLCQNFQIFALNEKQSTFSVLKLYRKDVKSDNFYSVLIFQDCNAGM